jgi:LPXTG-motif cell wall-anchored protein
MKFMKLSSFGVLITLCLLGALIVPKARADEWDKKTTLTFNEPVQVPGTTLSAGTYVFKLADSSDRTIVQIWNEDETRLITTILAIADYRAKTPDKTIVSFDERPVGQPEALKAWFYPGDNSGVEFVYPKQRATELVQANQQPVLSVGEDATDAASLNTAAVEPVAPPAVTVADNPQDSTEIAQVTTVETVELPQTASAMPSIALGGILLLAGAFGVRRLALNSR